MTPEPLRYRFIPLDALPAPWEWNEVETIAKGPGGIEVRRNTEIGNLYVLRDGELEAAYTPIGFIPDDGPDTAEAIAMLFEEPPEEDD